MRLLIATLLALAIAVSVVHKQFSTEEKMLNARIAKAEREVDTLEIHTQKRGKLHKYMAMVDADVDECFSRLPEGERK